MPGTGGPARETKGHFCLLHPSPIVLRADDWELRDPGKALWTVLEAVADRPVALAVAPTWTVLDAPARQALLHWRARDRFPNVEIVVNVPDDTEAAALRRVGEPTFVCSVAALTREDTFFPLHDREPAFDAVYDARWADYKRHALCAGVRSLALIAHSPAMTPEYEPLASAAVEGATYFNHPSLGRWLPLDEVNAAYNRARVGLCLSATEGCMYASVQYLMAGLPVVTTHNVGGRDALLPPWCTRWVEDDPAAVAAAVAELVALAPDPAEVRAAVLERVAPHRERFRAWVEATIVARGGDPGRWALGWPPDLPDKLQEWVTTDVVIERLVRA